MVECSRQFWENTVNCDYHSKIRLLSFLIFMVGTICLICLLTTRIHIDRIGITPCDNIFTFESYFQFMH